MYRIAREAKSRVSIVRSVSGVTANATISEISAARQLSGGKGDSLFSP
jgi:hypothetical protein